MNSIALELVYREIVRENTSKTLTSLKSKNRLD